MFELSYIHQIYLFAALLIFHARFFFQDYVGNKRLELSGQLVSLLFEVFIFLTISLDGVHYVIVSLTVLLLCEGFVQNDEYLCCRPYEQKQ